MEEFGRQLNELGTKIFEVGTAIQKIICAYPQWYIFPTIIVGTWYVHFRFLCFSLEIEKLPF